MAPPLGAGDRFLPCQVRSWARRGRRGVHGACEVAQRSSGKRKAGFTVYFQTLVGSSTHSLSTSAYSVPGTF